MVKGQASMEYMIIVGFSLLIVGILWITTRANIDDTQWELQLAYAKGSIERIAQTADSVYVQGEPSQTYITVYFPENSRAVYIQNDTVTLELVWKGILRNVSAQSIANLTGSLSPAPGQHRILVKAGNYVNITE